MNPLITPDQAAGVAIVISRVIAFFIGFPFLNTPFIPLNIRVLLVLAFSFFAMAHYNISLSIKDYDLLFFALFMMKEMLIGFSLGVVVTIFVSIFLYAAEIISFFMGFTIVNVFNPAFGQTSALSLLFLLLFYLLFFISGSYQMVIALLFKSFELVPVVKFSFNESVFEFVILKFGDIFKIGFQIAFPFALVLTVFNVVLALINRLIPQINVFFVGLPAQILIGFVVLVFSSSLIISIGLNLIDKMVYSMEDILKLIGR